jgi:hypothetical protein
VGVLPTIVTYIISLTRSETPRYAVHKDGHRQRLLSQQILLEGLGGAVATGTGRNRAAVSCVERDSNQELRTTSLGRRSDPQREAQELNMDTPTTTVNMWIEPMPKPFTRVGIKQHFWTYGNWRRLAATSLCWFALSISLCGLRINDPQIVFSMWGSHSIDTSFMSPGWLDVPQKGVSIYAYLQQDVVRAVIAACVGPVIGSIIFVGAVDYIFRKKAFGLSLLILAGILFIPGAIVLSRILQDSYGIRVSLFILCHIVPIVTASQPKQCRTPSHQTKVIMKMVAWPDVEKRLGSAAPQHSECHSGGIIGCSLPAAGNEAQLMPQSRCSLLRAPRPDDRQKGREASHSTLISVLLITTWHISHAGMTVQASRPTHAQSRTRGRWLTAS